MKVFYDWEFEENGSTIEPISLGIVAENNAVLYIANSDYDQESATEWLKENVLNNFTANLKSDGDTFYVGIEPEWMPEKAMAERIVKFLESLESDKIELVADYGSYDHVCLAQRFGTMMDMPKILPWVTYDIKQWCDDLGLERAGKKRIKYDPVLYTEHTKAHNALNDAYCVKQNWQWLQANYDHPAWCPELRNKRTVNADDPRF